jgi:hypothetical protein
VDDAAGTCYLPLRGGKRLLRGWFQRPLLNLEVINERLDAVEHFQGYNEANKLLSGVTRYRTEILFGGEVTEFETY